jgi:hypothetical protein
VHLNWRKDKENIPFDVPVIVRLDQTETVHNQYHIAVKKQTAKGFLLFVGHYFEWDEEPILEWAEFL